MEEVVARLELVAGRLEAAESRLSKLGRANGSVGSPEQPAPTKAVVQTPVAGPSVAGPSVSKQGSDSFQPVNKACREFLDVAERIGGEVLAASRVLTAGVTAVEKLLPAFSTCKPPVDASETQTLLRPVADQLEAVEKLGTSGPRSPYTTHFKVVHESAQALTWVAYSGPETGMSPPPALISEAAQAADFYAIKVLKDWRPKDPAHGEWVATLKKLLKAMEDFTALEYPRGPQWNAGGPSVSEFLNSSEQASTASTKAAKKAGGPPPAAPPPPPPGSLNKPKAPESSSEAKPTGMAALFADLNRGEAVTSGLRKVTADMKTKNRNPDDMAASAPSAPKPPTRKPTASSSAPAKQPKLELVQGQKWNVEYQNGVPDLVISETEPKQTVYIYNCRESTIQIKGKVNSICLDRCSKVGLLFDAVVSSVELVNSTSMGVQCTDTVPTLAIDACDGVQVYLSSKSLDTDITTAKSSSVNIIVPGANEDDEPMEVPVPEQFVTRSVNGKWVTSPVSHSAG